MPAALHSREELVRFATFLLVGLCNTAVGLGIAFVALRLGAGDYRANALGYAVGMAVSYLLNRRFTFAAERGGHGRQAPRFLVAAGLSYLLNLGVIAVGHRLGLRESMLLQVAAMGAYSLCFYLLSRLFVFRGEAA